MDLTYYREREKQERAFAAQAMSAGARHAHMDLADRYRAVIEAHERLDQLAENRSSTAA